MHLLTSMLVTSVATGLATGAMVGCGPGKPAAGSPATAGAGDDRASHASASDSSGPERPDRPTTVKTLAEIGLDAGAIDRSTDPCDDFYQFACGGWISRTEIPADKPLTMRSFVEIDDRNEAYLHEVLEKAAAGPGSDSGLAKLGTYYASCMDEAAIEKAGTRPLAPFLASIARVKDSATLTAAVASLHAAGMNALFVLGPVQDSADATQVIGQIEQGGIGLPDRDYYLTSDEQTVKVRGAYQAYVAALLEAGGHKPGAAAKEAADIIALETEIAKVSKDKVARRDPRGTYNKIDRAGVAQAMSHFDWDHFWKEIGLRDIQGITVTAPGFLTGVDRLIESTRPETWRAYLTFHLLSRSAAFLTRKLQETRFKFEQALTGQPEMQARWKRCVGFTDAALGDLLGQVFVRDKFAGDSKQAAEDEVHAISTAMSQRIAALPWMDAATRARAQEKLDRIVYHIGYPAKWKTYPFKVDRKAFAANAFAARRAERARELAKIGKPVERDEWDISPPTVNAYYDPQLNCMVFPAGILQPPFYDVRSAVPVNLGGMGVVVGHELTHGFDDQGSQYDALGNLFDWWQPATRKEFKARTQCVIDQYSRYEQAGTRLNGANTVGENIADIGGVKLALAAYRAMRANAPEAVVADGFTEDQQFFLAFGQAWCAVARPDYEKLLVQVDVHSPPRWRVNGALRANRDFSGAFHCKARAKMVPEKMCEVW